ncbi:carbohydrate ABC transporter permease [Niameybacter massiliensis]|uniref:Carbohydrate ABC transporter permease n=1 Tax=Holtiella tumoricola TaxID=3018743 RepID=A0AA42DL11_9FIRM|nr:carbohydrate ABC transporter permease [Holtiella tumoricola]MDA3731040.1 carbohydrate ABC transporter permease [Holtiella tumoricola]
MEKKQTHNLGRIMNTTLLRCVLIITSVLVILPITWVIYTSFKTSAEFLKNPWALPSTLNWQNYANAIDKANMGSYFINSIGVTLGSLILLFILIVPVAYALSRFEFKLNKWIVMLFMAGLFISSNYIVVPIFMILKDLGGLNKLWVLCFVYAATTMPFNTYLLTGFMQGIPKEYEEAAQIDGCGYWGTLFKVIIPMSKPGFVTIGVFAFMSYWNEYIMALTVLKPDKYTLPVGLKNLMEVQKYATDWGAMFAGLVIVMVPTMLFYALVQKRLTSGLSIGGLKG